MLFGSNFSLTPQRLACLCLSSAWIKGVHHYVQSCNEILYFYLKLFFKSLIHDPQISPTVKLHFLLHLVLHMVSFFDLYAQLSVSAPECTLPASRGFDYCFCSQGFCLFTKNVFYSPINVSPASDIFLLFASLLSYILVYFREILIRSFLCSGN